MKIRLGKTINVFVLVTAAAALAGCLMGSETDEPSAVKPTPPPPPTNSAPIISGNPPPAVLVGQNYSFTPTASDPDGDMLTFSIQGRPAWASFDTTTGTLSGLAALGTEGTYPDIRITVSDGQLSANTPLFSIEVSQAALGSATLTWTAPTQNTDGSPLLNLAAYKIYYGTSPGSYTTEILISNPGMTTHVVDNLVPNTYYFVATCINSIGVESVFSGMASMTVAAN